MLESNKRGLIFSGFVATAGQVGVLGAKHSPPGHQRAPDCPRSHPPLCAPGYRLIHDISFVQSTLSRRPELFRRHELSRMELRRILAFV